MGDNLFTQCYKLMNVKLPQSIDHISAGMFQNCLMLAGIEISQGAESIGGSAFASCSALTTVIIPDSVTKIETAAFSDCPLRDIYFTGTEAQWNRINKAADVSSAVTNATIHYGYVPEEPTPPDETTPPDEPTPPGETTRPGQTTPPGQTTRPGQTTPSEPDTKLPIINNGSGKKGWEAIKEEAANSSDGMWVHVDMNGVSVVPGDVLDSVKGQNVTLAFDMGNGIVWYVNGRNVTADHANDVNLSVQVGTSAIPKNIVNATAGDRQAIQLSLAHSGDFGCSAVLRVNVDPANAGLYANLFYYNEKARRLEFVTEGQIDKDGNVDLTFTHASEYVIVIDDEAMDQGSGGGNSGSSGGTASSDGKGTERKSPRTGE